MTVVIFSLKKMEIIGSIGALPEEEHVDQTLFLDIDVATQKPHEVSDYKLKNSASEVLKEGFEHTYQYAEKLATVLKSDLKAEKVLVTVCKTSSLIGIPTYVTVEK